MNVYGQLATQESESLADKLASNNDLSNVILALLGRLIVMCRDRFTCIEGVRLTPIDTRYEGKEFVLSSHVTFHPLNLRPPTFWRPSTEFEAFTESRAQGLALALKKSPALSKFFQSLVEKIDAWATYKRIPFSSLRIQHPFISKDDVLVIGVGRDLG